MVPFETLLIAREWRVPQRTFCGERSGGGSFESAYGRFLSLPNPGLVARFARHIRVLEILYTTLYYIIYVLRYDVVPMASHYPGVGKG